ncbi:ECF-type sigma factor [Engelhardtia mirabilis]|uniref:RNA polymerase sigma factor n=1 Tax=Engelhardtia mirabilis TaxID=2528011 RepID=A0A518BE13_9BACT|nr:RNA polymerase sigma factor [Planctomycetes bacterium Pla133]QDU99555.1 RNA polymerase sigma factor [Planctomycetes bacterium Pla86]
MPETDVTHFLERLSLGDEHAAERLLEVVYAELRALAAAKLAQEAPGHTLQPTALVHEAWLRLVGDERADWKSRRYFFGACAEAMRRILIERARRRGRLKHGGDRQRVELDDLALQAETVDAEAAIDLLALDEALVKLAAEDPLKAELVQLRFFAGLTLDQVAQTLGLSPATVDRHWAFARAFLFHEIQGRGSDPGS